MVNFKIFGQNLDYLSVLDYEIYKNELTVQIPLCQWASSFFYSPILIGDLTSKFINGDKPRKVESFKGKEVLGFGHLDHSDVNKTLDNSFKYFLTFPIGLSQDLNNTIKFADKVFVMQRSSVRYDIGKVGKNLWEENFDKNIFFLYGFLQGSANAIVILTNIKEIKYTKGFSTKKLNIKPLIEKKRSICCN